MSEKASNLSDYKATLKSIALTRAQSRSRYEAVPGASIIIDWSRSGALVGYADVSALRVFGLGP